jgi:16S rRNA processing protein RimM
LKGQLKVDPMTDFVSRFERGARLMLRDEWVEVESMTIHKGRPLLKLRGVDDLTAAEKLQWEYLSAIGRPELDEDEFLAEDLVGLEVFTEEGEQLGVVDDVLPYPAQDVLVVGEIMVPLVKEFVKEIDPDAGRVTVHLIPGMRPGED